MLWIKAFHIISLVIWFSGLFYLPRLFVYHAGTRDEKTNERFLVMEKKLYFWVTNPGAACTLLFGTILLYMNPATILRATWLQLKLVLVLFLLLYHFYLGYLLWRFIKRNNHHSTTFYRWLNEIPTLFLISIILLVILKPAF